MLSHLTGLRRRMKSFYGTGEGEGPFENEKSLFTRIHGSIETNKT